MDITEAKQCAYEAQTKIIEAIDLLSQAISILPNARYYDAYIIDVLRECAAQYEFGPHTPNINDIFDAIKDVEVAEED